MSMPGTETRRGEKGATAVPLWELSPSEDCGLLEVELDTKTGCSQATRARANYPLKFLLPRSRTDFGNAVWVYTVTFGGGLLAGDKVWTVPSL